jgi:type II secretory pathway component GspD/PulD (secretin)
MHDRHSVDNTKVPLLGDVPFVGNLFKRTETRSAKTDLIILLTPTIMGPIQAGETTARELRRLDNAQKAADRKR